MHDAAGGVAKVVTNSSIPLTAASTSSAFSSASNPSTSVLPAFGVWRGAKGVPLAPGSSWRLLPQPQQETPKQQDGSLQKEASSALGPSISNATYPAAEYMPCVTAIRPIPATLAVLATCSPSLRNVLTNLTLRHPSPYRRTRPSAAVALEFAVGFERVLSLNTVPNEEVLGQRDQGGMIPTAEYAVVLSAHNEATALRTTLRPLLQLTVGTWELA